MKKGKHIIVTKRLYLRESTVEDAALAYELNLDPEVIRYTGDPAFVSVAEAKEFLSEYKAFDKHKMGRWYVFLKADDTFIGWCGLKYHEDTNEVDLGYRLLKKYWNRGYATEASSACLEYGFETLRIPMIYAQADMRNKASIKVMQKIGMSYVRNIDFEEDPGVRYEISREEFISRKRQ